MRFYGTLESLDAWRAIIESELDKECSTIADNGSGRLSFRVNLTSADREFLQKKYWYATEDGHNLPWNSRISHDGS